MKIILLRHATRDLGGVADCSLNRTGVAMAEALVEKQAPRGDLPKATRLLSSPKKRARETLLPLSRALDVLLQTSPELDERHHEETQAQFKKRVQSFLNNLRTQFADDDVIYLCSHADWLEDAMVLLPSDASDVELRAGFACAETRVFEWADGIWHYSSTVKGV